ncbi:DUF4468 domain-containing protein [Olleya sp. UBA1516]|uniref:DUF4468 domain-containing protein n=1 Tax=Olleya sp. UBA1516 TaxID=1947013 RepID=UPI0025ED3D93|nr:DUF4468 domain-containing protein [Olleya sp. UBA1516]|tara:strand:- start:702 stop:1382 length:681 start_codon:yes stop_codon:yes gene_type:complete
MKNIKVLFGIIVLTIISSQSYSQEYEVDQNTVIKIFEIDGRDKSELFSSVNKWISINYNSANNVIQLDDKESGDIIVKGINTLYYESEIPYKPNGYVPHKLNLSFRHMIEINIKDNKFRVKFTMLEIDKDNSFLPKCYWTFDNAKFYNLFSNCVSLKGTSAKALLAYNEQIAKVLKGQLAGKKKKKLILEQNKFMFEEMNEKIKADIYLKLESIKSSVISDKKDGW